MTAPTPGAVSVGLLSVALFVLPSEAIDADVTTQQLLIQDVTLVSVAPDAPLTPVDVAIRGDRITAIASDLPADGYALSEIINGTGRFLSPGLIDGHVHLTGIPGMHAGHEAEFPEIAAAARRQIPRSYLYHGFTTVIDLIGNPGQIDAWNRQAIRPQAYFCGSAPVRDGYPTHRIPLPARYHAAPNFLFDPDRPEGLPPGIAPTLHSPRVVAARIAHSGAIGIKTFWEDGFGPARDLPVPSPSLLRELVSAARIRGLPVLMHANSDTAQLAGIDAGVSAFVHGMWTWDSGDAPELTPPVRAVLDSVVHHKIGWQPTIQVLYGERDLFDPDYFDRPDVRAIVPARVIEWYRSPAGQWFADEMRNIPYVSESLAKGRWQDIDSQPIRHVMQALSYLAERDGRLLFGTDTPSAPTYGNPAGLNGRLEMNHWIAAGVSPRQLFEAATIANAAFFDLDAEIGSVEVGKRADLLLLGASPVETVAAYDQIEQVIIAGRIIDRRTLAAAE